MASRISFNIHAQMVKDTPRLKRHLQKINPSTVLVLDGLGLAQEIKAMLPDCIVIHRNYGVTKGDDNLQKRISPEAWLDLRAKEAEGGLYLYTVNEPAFDQQCVDWHVQLMEECVQRSIHLVVGNWAVGNPGADDWGRARRMLELLDQHRSLFILGLHEYACGIITSGLFGGYPDNAGVQPGKPGGQNLIPRDRWPVDVTKITMFHCGRFKFLVNYCQNNNLKPPRIILTEHGMDDVSDIKPWSEKLDKTAHYLSIRGWKSLRNQWNSWFNPLGWSAERAYFEQLKWADQTIYRNSPVEGQCVFSWGHSSGDWEQFDVAEAGEFQSLLEAYAQNEEKPPVPVVPPEVQPKVLSKPTNATRKYTVQAEAHGMNVRTGPAVVYPKISSSIIGEIQPGDFVRFWVLPDLPKEEWLWAYCQIVTGDHALEEGWLYLPDFSYRLSATKEIPVIKPPQVLQSHTFSVKVVAPAPNGDVMAQWLRKQLESAGILFANLDQVKDIQFEVEEVQ